MLSFHVSPPSDNTLKFSCKMEHENTISQKYLKNDFHNHTKF